MIDWLELYAGIAYRTGWSIPHIREEIDLPTLAAMREQWEQYPPLPVMVAHYLGAAKPKTPESQIERLEDQDFIPVNRMPAHEFDALLETIGLPTGTP
ncbi:MAG: hypothetical protein ABL877_10805 [Thiobacillus sp.]